MSDAFDERRRGLEEEYFHRQNQEAYEKLFPSPMSSRTIQAPRGATLSCKSWHQEAALRCLMNNLDPNVAEKPDELVVYGGAGKAARNWASFDAIVGELRELENDETL